MTRSQRVRVINSQRFLLIGLLVVSSVFSSYQGMHQQQTICTTGDAVVSDEPTLEKIKNSTVPNEPKEATEIHYNDSKQDGQNLSVDHSTSVPAFAAYNSEVVGINIAVEEGKHVIFYNAFVNPTRIQHSLQIMQEQMMQVYNSSQRNATIFYNIVGNDLRHRFCPDDMDCRKLNYIKQGDEVDTLQDLHKHCLAHPNDVVTYLHDKGSFNNMGRNNGVRRLATRSATSEACKYMDMHKKFTCNLCAMKIFFLPNTHTMGNMWTANCTYIRKLIPPKEFERRRREMFVHIKRNNKILERFHCFSTLLDGVDAKKPYKGNYSKHLGLNRYAMETWVFSHPDLIPCHTIPGNPTNYNPWEWDRVKLSGGAGLSAIQYLGETATGWFQAYGRIFTYQYLYESLPPQDSWFWERIPQSFVKEENKIRCEKSS